jgi:hypothetical protein
MLEMEMAKILSPMGGEPSSWAWPEWFAKPLRVLERIAAGTRVHQGGRRTYLHFLKHGGDNHQLNPCNPNQHPLYLYTLWGPGATAPDFRRQSGKFGPP